MLTITPVPTDTCYQVTSAVSDFIQKSDLEKIDVSEDDMLRVYKRSYYVSINNSDPVFCGYGHILGNRKTYVENQLLLDNATFDDAVRYLGEHYLPGLSLDETLFGHKPVICLWGDSERCRYKKFDSITYTVKFKECPDITPKWLEEYLPADKYFQYCIEHMIKQCKTLFEK